jgi:integrase
VYRDGAGRQVNCTKDENRVPHRSQTHAERHHRAMLNERPDDVAAGRITLRAVYDEMVRRHEDDGTPYAAATLAFHDAAWKHLDRIAGVEVGKLDPATISRTLGAIEGAEMRTKVRNLLGAIFRFAMARTPRYITTSPMPEQIRGTTRAARKARDRGANTKLRILTDDELARLIVEMPERYRALVKLMAYVGLRPGEAVALTVGKLDTLDRTLKVDTAVSGDTKTGKARTIALPTAVVEMLTEHLARFSDPADLDAPMFPRSDGTPISSKDGYDAWARRHFRPAAERAGVNHGISPNDLRHQAAARAIGLGSDVFVVQRMLGHARPSITLDTYAFLWQGRDRQVADTLDTAIREAEAVVPKDAKVISI